MTNMINNSIVTMSLINKETGETIDLREVKGNIAYKPVVKPITTRDGRQTKVCNITFVMHGDNDEAQSATAAFWGAKADEVAANFDVGDFIAVNNCVLGERSYVANNGETRTVVECNALKGSNIRMECKLLKKASRWVDERKLVAKAETKVEAKVTAPAVEAKVETKVEAKTKKTSTKAKAVTPATTPATQMATVEIGEDELPF